jgi:hypothetical protein
MSCPYDKLDLEGKPCFDTNSLHQASTNKGVVHCISSPPLITRITGLLRTTVAAQVIGTHNDDQTAVEVEGLHGYEVPNNTSCREGMERRLPSFV